MEQAVNAAINLDTVRAPQAARLVTGHLDALAPAVSSLRGSAGTLARWGTVLAQKLAAGQRLLVAGNGGSAAEAQHLTAELVGRFDGERGAYSAISLHAETSAFSAISNDYGYDQSFARQVRAHGREGDVLLLLSTSGRSPNLLQAAQAARQAGLATWALVGQGPTRLSDLCDESVEIQGPSANVQECHLVAIHAICRVFDAAIAAHEREASKGAWQ
ncbi:SIS domain-containing protein [Glutamicibacter sp. V16R2B1]|uniref:D-sedoheptulose-7-phosphate isomerase n=1 Tax=Glutamicibacter sp. V16R2B1 TaxID=2036207 RepID=UPI0010FDA19E|nr:SIS domain-containing protein [Glutamicibacter sp. V16R2B1]TLK52707.1 SIS domain-containing protein [Glutamicibacter sp. V16R2B1]